MKSRCNQQIKSKNRVKDFGEVYTQEREVKAMLDLVKEESYKTNSLFLEPACGNGNFLIEILKRKLSACETREDVLISLSSIYAIDILEDNILESKERLFELVKYALTREEAFFIMNKNIVCGNSLELLNEQKYLDMKFDVIIGNPPYQLNTGGQNAVPIYHKFIEQAKKLNPRYISMIIPSRWFSGGMGLDSFRESMLKQSGIKTLVDYPDANDCFSNVSIKGGVCYFLWDKHHNGNCLVKTIQSSSISIMERELMLDGVDIFIRYNEAVSIFKKVKSLNEPSISANISSQRPFGLKSAFVGSETSKDILVYGNKRTSFCDKEEITQNQDWIDDYKVIISKAYGAGEKFPHQILSKPIIATPGTCCTETYIVLTRHSDLTTALNARSYVQTKFFRFLVMLKKNTQNALKGVYEFVPMQDFSKPWTDEELYKKYNLTDDEINYIESMIKPMDL